MISIIIVLACFVGVIVAIATDKLNRAAAAMYAALITYFVLIFVENLDFSVIFYITFGTEADGFSNFHSLLLIISMMIIVAISHEAGFFQYIAIRLIKLSKAKPIRLMIISCLIIVLIAAFLNNLLAVIICIPLTITVSRILNIDPHPYILMQAVTVNLGGSIFLISSIPNILISSYVSINFAEFFLNVGILSLFMFIFTMLYFIFLYKKELNISPKGLQVINEFNPWNLVQNKRLFYEVLIGFAILMSFFVIIPSSVISSDIIALAVALILILVSKLKPKEIFKKIDYELIIYLIGIFIIVGALEELKLLDAIGQLFSNIGAGSVLIQILFILWVSAFLSSAIDNIPITQVLIPVIGLMSVNATPLGYRYNFYSLAIGANWGDNLTPLGDNILVMNVAEQNKRHVSFKLFFKLGFTTTIYQLILISIYFTLIFQPITGIFLIFILIMASIILILIYKLGNKRLKLNIEKIVTKIRNKIIK